MKGFIPLGKILNLLIPLKSYAAMIAIFLIASGSYHLHSGWLFLIVHFAGTILGALFIRYFAPDSVSFFDFFKLKNIRLMRDQPLINLSLLFFFIPLIAGLDMRVFGRDNLNIAYLEGGVLLYAICFFISHWAFLTDTLIKTMRGKNRVISDGPYEIVRHPKYLAIILGALSLSFMTGSIFSLIPSALAVITIIWHTNLEDKRLRKKSKGYRIYAERIRFRLVPGIW